MTIRRAAWFAAIGNYVVLLLQFFAVIIATRLLPREDIGGFAVASAIFNVLAQLVDFGISRYVVHIKEASRERLGSSALVSWVVAISIWSFVWFGAERIGAFFGRPDLVVALRIMSISLCLYPFIVIGSGQLYRDMRQDWAAFITISRSAMQACVSIALIVKGFRLEALAIGFAAGFLCEWVIVIALFWRFSLVPPHMRGIADVVRFGSCAAGTSAMTQLGNGAPDIVIGRMLGLAETGIYSRSVALVGLIKRGFDTVMIAVALPGFSKLIREGGDPRPMYLTAVSVGTGFTWPFFAWLIVLADPVVNILYGPRWPEVVGITRLVTLTYFGIAIVSMAQPFLIAVRREAVLFRIEFFSQLIRAALVGIGAWCSLTAALIALILGSCIQLGIMLVVLHKVAKISLRDVVASAMRSIPLAVAATGGSLLGLVSGFGNNWAILVIGSLGALVFCISTLLLIPHPLSEELDNIRVRIRRLATRSPPDKLQAR